MGCKCSPLLQVTRAAPALTRIRPGLWSVVEHSPSSHRHPFCEFEARDLPVPEQGKARDQDQPEDAGQWLPTVARSGVFMGSELDLSIFPGASEKGTSSLSVTVTVKVKVL